ncbi:MAG: hypothetical protein ACI9E5_001289 [Candidatus Omnitrophota bacterium]|jgi:hypothetical protein
MLKLLRKKDFMKKITWVIAVIIILSFGVFGTAYLLAGNTGNSSNTYAGKIFGKKVPLDEFQKAYQDMHVQAIMRYGDKYNEVRQYLNLEAETWDRLIVLREAKKRRLKVTNKEIVETIQSYPFFQRNNQFDTPLYNNVVRYVFEMKPRAFEESIRDSIKVAKVISDVTKELSITDNDVLNTYKEINSKVQVSYLHLSPDNFKDQAVYTEEEVQEYYVNNKIEFLVPPSINLEYIELPLIEATDEDTSVEANEVIRQKATSIHKELASNNNLVEVATNNGLKVLSSGFFSREEPDLKLGWSFDVFNQVFQLELNSITEPVESSNKILIIKLAEKREAIVPDYKDAQEKVIDKVLRINSTDITRVNSEKILASVELEYGKLNNNFNEAAKSIGHDVVQTPEFNRGQYLPEIGISAPFQEAAFRLSSNNKISGVIEAENGFYILHLDNTIEADEENFAEEKEELMNTLLNEKRNVAFGEFLTSLRQEAQLEDFISKQRQSTQ